MRSAQTQIAISTAKDQWSTKFSHHGLETAGTVNKAYDLSMNGANYPISALQKVRMYYSIAALINMPSVRFLIHADLLQSAYRLQSYQG
jgi:hypothetical protein